MPFDSTNATLAAALSLADRYGRAKALFDAAEAELEDIKAEIKASGQTEIVGDEFVVTVGESLRELPNTDALKAHFGADWGKWTKISYSQSVRVKAVASARLKKAA